MSGGVDSSVTAAMLPSSGYDVVGVTMKLFCHGDVVSGPAAVVRSIPSIAMRARVCAQLGVPHYVLNLEPTFAHDVIDGFRDGVFARANADSVRAMQHVYQVPRSGSAGGRDRCAVCGDRALRACGRTECCRAGATRARTRAISSGGSIGPWSAGCCFPWGANQGRDAGARAGAGALVVADKVESQDICFVPDGDHMRVFARRLGRRRRRCVPGPFVTLDGRVIGEHDGYRPVHSGQRRGLPGGAGQPETVVAIHAAERAVVVGTREDLLGRGPLHVNWNWRAATSLRASGSGSRPKYAIVAPQ